MWILILLGGGISVIILGPASITGFGDLNTFLASVLKGGIAIVLVILWIFILSKLKNWIFRKKLNF